MFRVFSKTVSSVHLLRNLNWKVQVEVDFANAG